MLELLHNPDVVIALITAVSGAVIAFFAIFKGGDLLRELRQRKMYRLRAKFRATCPHVTFETIETEEGIQRAARRMFEFIEGSNSCTCSFCGMTMHVGQIVRFHQSLRDAPEEEVKQVLEMLENAKKLRLNLDSLGNWESV